MLENSGNNQFGWLTPVANCFRLHTCVLTHVIVSVSIWRRALTYMKRGIFRWTYYTELSGDRAWRISQRPSRRWTYSRSTLRKSLRAADDTNFRSTVNRDRADEYRHQLDALEYSRVSLRFLSFLGSRNISGDWRLFAEEPLVRGAFLSEVKEREREEHFLRQFADKQDCKFVLSDWTLVRFFIREWFWWHVALGTL